MRRLICQFASDERGATAIEYALIGTLISVAILASAGLVGNAVNNLFMKTGNGLTEAKQRLQ